MFLGRNLAPPRVLVILFEYTYIYIYIKESDLAALGCWDSKGLPKLGPKYCKIKTRRLQKCARKLLPVVDNVYRTFYIQGYYFGMSSIIMKIDRDHPDAIEDS